MLGDLGLIDHVKLMQILSILLINPARGQCEYNAIEILALLLNLVIGKITNVAVALRVNERNVNISTLV